MLPATFGTKDCLILQSIDNAAESANVLFYKGYKKSQDAIFINKKIKAQYHEKSCP